MVQGGSGSGFYSPATTEQWLTMRSIAWARLGASEKNRRCGEGYTGLCGAIGGRN